MKSGEVILALMPQADRQEKLRPSLVLCETAPFGDLLICGITTQTHLEVSGLDDLLMSSDDDFLDTGLSEDSLIRVTFISTIAKRDVRGILGRVSAERLTRVLESLSTHLLAQRV